MVLHVFLQFFSLWKLHTQALHKKPWCLPILKTVGEQKGSWASNIVLRKSEGRNIDVRMNLAYIYVWQLILLKAKLKKAFNKWVGKNRPQRCVCWSKQLSGKYPQLGFRQAENILLFPWLSLGPKGNWQPVSFSLSGWQGAESREGFFQSQMEFRRTKKPVTKLEMNV